MHEKLTKGFAVKKWFNLSAIALQLMSGSAFAMDCFWDGVCDSVSIEGSYLYWQLYGDNFDYLNVKTRQVAGVAGAAIEKDYTQDMDWDSGFRLGLSFDLPCAGMDVKTTWTDFHTSKNDKQNVVGQANQVITTVASPYLADSSTYELAADGSLIAKQKERFDFDVVNLEFGKWFSPDCAGLSLRPHVGMQFVQFEEKRNFTSSSLVGLDFDASRNLHTKQKFHGYGLRSGIDMKFPLFCDLSLVGSAAASIDWGKRTTRVNFNSVVITDEESFNQKRHDRVNRSILDLSLGLRWETILCECWGLSLEALWEQHQLFNASQLWRLRDDADAESRSPFGASGDKHGDLSMRGLTVRAALTF